MKRFLPILLLASAVLAAAGCAGNDGGLSTSGRSRLVVAWGRKAVPGVTAIMDARLLSPTRLAIGVAGSGNCPQLPIGLSILDKHTISIRLVPHTPRNEVCLTDLSVGIPVVVAINPTRVDVHHRLTIRLYYGNNSIARTVPAL